MKLNNYTFSVLPPIFNALEGLSHSEIDNKRINEIVENIEIVVSAKDIKEAIEKAKKELSVIIPINFGHIRYFEYYLFKLKIIRIEVLS